MAIIPKIRESSPTDLRHNNSVSLDRTVELLQQAKKTNRIDQAANNANSIYNYLEGMPSIDSKILSAANYLSKYCMRIASDHYQDLAKISTDIVVSPPSLFSIFFPNVYSISINTLFGYLTNQVNPYPKFSNLTDQENHNKAMEQAGKLHYYFHCSLHSNIEDLKQAASDANDLLAYISDKESPYIAAAHYIAFYFNSRLSDVYKDHANEHIFLSAEENHFAFNQPQTLIYHLKTIRDEALQKSEQARTIFFCENESKRALLNDPMYVFPKNLIQNYLTNLYNNYIEFSYAFTEAENVLQKAIQLQQFIESCNDELAAWATLASSSPSSSPSPSSPVLAAS